MTTPLFVFATSDTPENNNNGGGGGGPLTVSIDPSENQTGYTATGDFTSPTYSAVLSGGRAPFTFSWSVIPDGGGGVITVNANKGSMNFSVTRAPSGPNSYTVNLAVTDSGSQTKFAATQYVVISENNEGGVNL